MSPLAGAMLATALACPAQRQFSEYRTRDLPIDNDPTRAVVALGADLVLGNYPQVRYWRNDGSGNFVDQTALRLPLESNSTQGIAAGDVDGDGDSDLVLAALFGNRLWLNDGTYRFGPAPAGRLPAFTWSSYAVVLADLDRDGDLDLVFANERQNALYANAGNGVFTDVTSTALPLDFDMSEAVVAADFDNDGDLDLVFGNSRDPSGTASQQDRIYVNDGTGRFTDQTATRFPVDDDPTSSIAAGDLDGDGDTDLVFGLRGLRKRLYLNDGTGRFSRAITDRVPPDSSGTEDVALADVDGDGDLDIVVANAGSFTAGQRNRLYANDGAARFVDVTDTALPADASFTYAVAVADVDRDGDPDLVFGNVGQDALLLNDGAGGFTARQRVSLPPARWYVDSVGVGDVDGDGDNDLVFGTDDQDLLFRNDGTAVFTEAPGALPTRLGETWDVRLADTDGDGDLDLATSGHGFVELWRNDGTGRYVAVPGALVPPLGNSAVAEQLAFGDVDADGDLDLAIACSSFAPQNRLYRNDGAAGFIDVTGTALPGDASDDACVTFGDVDRDGDLDLVFGTTFLPGLSYGAPDRLYRNDGRGRFIDDSAASLPPTATVTTGVAFADFDADGDLDLVLAALEPDDRVYLNDGTGRFADVTAGWLPGSSNNAEVAVTDVDEDGRPDLVFTGYEPSRLFVNTGAGGFENVTATRLPAVTDPTAQLAVGDLDFDGDADLVVTSHGQQSRVLINHHRQLSAPAAAVLGRTLAVELFVQPGYGTGPHLVLPFGALRGARFPLPPLGTLGLDPTALFSLGTVPFAPMQATSVVAVRVPNDPGLAGQRAWLQAVDFDSAVLRLTNWTNVELGR